jgi:hypothetical protein
MSHLTAGSSTTHRNRRAPDPGSLGIEAMSGIPPDILIDQLPGPKRSKWPARLLRDEAVWSPSNSRFALAYSIAEARMNNEIGCVLWGVRRERGTAILGNPAHVCACCWDIPWCVWLNDEAFVFKAQAGSGRKVHLPLVIVHISEGFALVPNTDNLESWPNQVASLPANVRWQNIRELSRAIQRGA